MPTPPSDRGPFEIDSSGAVARAFATLQLEALHAGYGREFRVAAHAVLDRLRNDPDEFGEPLYRLPAMRMQVRQAIVRPICVHYAVSEERAYVLIKSVKLLALGQS
jgi:hypothetical protein